MPALAAGEALGQKARLEDRLDDVAQSVVDHPVPEARRLHLPHLGVAHRELPVGAVAVGPGLKLLLQEQQLPLPAVGELGAVRAQPLALGRLAEGRVQVLEGDDPLVESFVCLHLNQ